MGVVTGSSYDNVGRTQWGWEGGGGTILSISSKTRLKGQEGGVVGRKKHWSLQVAKFDFTDKMALSMDAWFLCILLR